MSSRRMPLLAGSIALVLLLMLIAPAVRTLAQAETPTGATPAGATPTGAAPAEGTPAGAMTPTVATTPGTPTPTLTPTLTPTPTATLTSLQARLVLAQAFLEGRDFERAADLFAEIAQEDRGNPEALAGLTQALAGRASVEATIMAPPPTETPQPAPVAETFNRSVSSNLREIGGAALAALLVLVALYFLSHLIRWLLGVLRELWYMRALPLLGRPAVPPGYLIGDFTNTLGAAGEVAARIAPQAMTEKLIAWNQLVADKQVPVEPAPALQLGPMAWISIFWRWLLPPARGYRVNGFLSRGAANTLQLSVQRAALASNSIDRSATFASPNPSVEEAAAFMAGEAAKWLISPIDMEAAAPAGKTIREVAGVSTAVTPSLVFDRALDLLLPVRQQVNQGAVDFPTARQRIVEAQGLLQQLPSGSPLRGELEGVLVDLRRSVPG
jgi:hypothetical protein